METDIQEQIEAIAAHLETLRRECAKIDAEIAIEEREMKRLQAVVSRQRHGIAAGDTLLVTPQCHDALARRGSHNGFGKSGLEQWAVGKVAVVQGNGSDDKFSVWCDGGITKIEAELVMGMREAFLQQFGGL